MIEFVNVNSEQILNDMIISLQKALNEVLYPGDERRIFLEQQNQVIVALYNAINDAAKQNLLRYARGEVLDAIGEEKGVPRLMATKATTIVRFNLNEPNQNDILIPSGTRVTPDGELFFETVSSDVIKSGDTYIDIECSATVPGASHNGFTAGQINTLVDIIPLISSVENITTSDGGSDEEPDDDGVNVWSGYRERIRLSSSKASTAGHEYGYIYHAKSADQNIGDVVVTSPSAGEVLITAVMNDGSIPSQTILDKILEACSSKTVRPMTDKVSVAAPTQVEYDITLTYYISKENVTEEASINNDITLAINEYINWQNNKIGRDINPDKLRQLMLNAGASRIEVTAPVYTEILETQIPKCNIKTITYGGLE